MDSAEIESIPLFAGLSPEQLARVARVARPIHFDPGQAIVQEGEFSFEFYAIREGVAEVRRRGEHIAKLGAGDFLGELGVVPHGARHWTRRREATVIVTAPTDAIAIDGHELRRITEEIPA